MRPDPHSYADDAQPDVAELDWRVQVDFGERRLRAEVTLTLKEAGAGPLDLDTRELTIHEVVGPAGPLPFQLAPADPVLGSRLRIELPPGTRQLTVRYHTSPLASALQWLSPAQTRGGEHPFLFTQCQAIHARSILPVQDTPRVRLRYRAELTAPSALQAVMAAAARGRTAAGAVATSRFEMPQPIPPYLIAFAVGDLAAKDLSPRSRVWAEPALLDAAAWEFAEVERMIAVAEGMFGPYDWERFDILTMPPSFPYGGMENPRLTFLTPTVIAGDRSLVNVLAHELAHSWTGNLVTNASAEHFWLNEGFTVFAERRILEALEGPEAVALHAALGRRALDHALDGFKDRPELTRLRTHLANVDPDDCYSQVPYEKGYLFLRALEQAVGKDRFTAFLRHYVGTFQFQSITTEQFLALAQRELPGALDQVGADRWLNGTFLPADAPRAASARLELLERRPPTLPTSEEAKRWSPTEWQLFLESLPRPSPLCRDLDERFSLSASGNAELRVAWLTLACASGYAPALPHVERLLGEVGRMKYLRPLYAALAERAETRELAGRCFARCRGGYHPIAEHVVRGLLARHAVPT